MIDGATDIRIVVAGGEVRGWLDYNVTSSLLDPVAQFTMSMPYNKAAWKLLRKEQRCKVVLGGVTVLTGILDEREVPESDDEIQVSGRNLFGRLVQESAPAVSWQGQTLTQLVARLASPWFTSVVLSNAKNRRLLLGKGHKAVVGNEPIRIDPRPGGLLAEPGTVRMAIIEELLQQAGMVCWPAGDGTVLVIGQPNYNQEPQWRLFRPAPGSSRGAEATVLGMGVKVTTADRFSRVIVTGSGRGTTANYGPAVASRYGVARVGSAPDGTGGDFAEPKTIVMQQAVQSAAEARQLAARELAKRESHGVIATATVAHHGQRVAGAAARTTFTPDTIAHLEHEMTETKGAFVITSCTYTSSRRDGERTRLELLRSGSVLSL